MAHNGRLLPPIPIIESWPAPNLVDPQTKHGLLPACIILAVASVVAVSLRFYARAVILKKVGADDWMILGAMVPTVGLTIVICLAGTTYKFGYHVWDIISSTFVGERKVAFALEIFYMFSTSMTKLSMLIFYLRLSAGPTLTKPFRRLVWATIIFVVVFLIAYLLALLLSCRPLNAYWASFDVLWEETHEYYCDNQGASLLAACSTSVLLDFIIVLLPMMLLWDLELPKSQKVGLAAVFAMGLFTCMAGIIRIKYVYVAFYESWDATWVFYDLFVWTAVEALMGITSASAPALKVFFRNTSHLLPTSLSSSRTKNSANSSATVSFRHRRSPFPNVSRATTPPAPSIPSSNGTMSEEAEEMVTIIDEKDNNTAIGKAGAAVASKELRHYDSLDAVSTIGSLRQPSPPPRDAQKTPKVTTTTTPDERKTSKLSFDSMACYGRPSNDPDAEKTRNVKSFEAPREGRVGIRRNQSFENGGARSRASLLGEVRIERMVEVVLEDREGGEGMRGEETGFR